MLALKGSIKHILLKAYQTNISNKVAVEQQQPQNPAAAGGPSAASMPSELRCLYTRVALSIHPKKTLRKATPQYSLPQCFSNHTKTALNPKPLTLNPTFSCLRGPQPLWDSQCSSFGPLAAAALAAAGTPQPHGVSCTLNCSQTCQRSRRLAS